MSPCKALWVVVLSVCVRICSALPSVPVATDPIVTTTTISTVLPSLVTIYSVVPATDDPNAISTITTTIDGQQTIVTAPDGVIAGSSTSTIISTISLATTQVVVSTIGYSTVFGPDPVAAVSSSQVSICCRYCSCTVHASIHERRGPYFKMALIAAKEDSALRQTHSLAAVPVRG
jgi:hypothetical protein